MHSNLSQNPDFDKAKIIVCALIHAEGGKFRGKTRLNKAFWRAHVYHYRHNSGLLSKYPIARLPEGPAIDDLDQLLFALEQEGRILITEQAAGPYLETVMVLKSNPPRLQEDEAAAIADAIRWIKNKSASQVAKESHRLSYGWKTLSNGDIIDVQMDALDANDLKARAAEARTIAKNLNWAEEAMREAFGG